MRSIESSSGIGIGRRKIDTKSELPWSPRQSELLKEAVDKHTFAVPCKITTSGERADTKGFVLWRTICRDTPGLEDYPLDFLIQQRRLDCLQEHEADFHRIPYQCEVLPYLDNYRFVRSGNVLSGDFFLYDCNRNGVRPAHEIPNSDKTKLEYQGVLETGTLCDDALETIPECYVGSKSLSDGTVQIYELGDPSSMPPVAHKGVSGVVSFITGVCSSGYGALKRLTAEFLRCVETVLCDKTVRTNVLSTCIAVGYLRFVVKHLPIPPSVLSPGLQVLKDVVFGILAFIFNWLFSGG